MLGSLIDKLRGRFRSRERCVDFYCSTWIDEIWVRSSALAARRAGFATRLIVSNDRDGWPLDFAARYARAGIPLEWAPSVASLQALACRVVVTASSGIPRGYFGESLVRLIHMPHSLASLHVIYEPNAFDGCDTLFAAGPHHAREFEILGRANGLGSRLSFPAGYGKFDVMREEAPAVETPAGKHVLIAPSWGENNLLNLIGLSLTEHLVGAGWNVTLRPHPSFFFSPDGLLDSILERFVEDPRVSVERSTGGSAALWTADALVTDYSGFALEFAALRQRPCLFVDGPRKILNPGWGALGQPAAEIDFRERLGLVVETGSQAILDGLGRLAAAGSLGPDVLADFLYEEPRIGERVLALLANDIPEVNG
ncbi:hypothetical protein [uncultured Bosea sp.]|uniref:hypothetical protein n=1 Tax=uncultured Bosea sp. TaxID=211457 RepID=UPI0025D7DAE4|nr:hypothetical protein [uncultured Bosea sp.]